MDRLSLKLIFANAHISRTPFIRGCVCGVGGANHMTTISQLLGETGAAKRARLSFDLGAQSVQDLVRAKMDWCGECSVEVQERVWELIVAFIDSVRNQLCQCGVPGLLRGIMGVPSLLMEDMDRITSTEKRVRRKWPSFQVLPDDVLACMFTAEGTALYGVRLHTESTFERAPPTTHLDAAMFAAHVLRTHFPRNFWQKQSVAQALVVEIMWRGKSSVTSRESARQFTLAMLAASDRSVRVFVEMAPRLTDIAQRLAGPKVRTVLNRALGGRLEFVDAVSRSAANRVRVERDIVRRVLGVTSKVPLSGLWATTGGSPEALGALVFRAAAHSNCAYTVGVQALAQEMCAVRGAGRRQSFVTTTITHYFDGQGPFEAMVERWPRIGEYVAGRLAATAREIAAQCFLEHFLSGAELESALKQLDEDACNGGKCEWPSLATNILYRRRKCPKKFKKVTL